MSASSRTLRKRTLFTSCFLVTAALACSSAQHDDAERAGTSSQALTATSCQGLDIAARGDSTYAIDLGGKVWGWGANDDPFPLGRSSSGSDGLGTVVTAPADLHVSGATKVAAGPQGACAIVPNTIVGQVVECWGLQLGSASSVDPQPAPVQYQDGDQTLILGGVTDIAVGDHHACALTASAQVWCWGADNFGQLGDGPDGVVSADTMTMSAVRMIGVSNVTHIAAAGDTTCVRQADGKVLCAGNNFYGQLGQGSSDQTGMPSPTPTAVKAAAVTFTSVTGGGKGTFCASTAKVGTSQTTYCWGANDDGQTGAGNLNQTSAPFPVSTEADAVFFPGNTGGCAIKGDRTVSCWGLNGHGLIPATGADASVSGLVLTPTQVVLPNGAPLTGAIKLAVGDTHACALTTTGLFCWGDDASGQIGDGGGTPDTAPVTSLRLSVPALQCGNGAVGATCNVLTNTCGEQLDCSNTCSALNACDATSHTCVDNPKACVPSCGVGELCNNHVCQLDPNYCASGCPIGDYCNNRQCAAYCVTQPISSASVGVVVAGANVTVTSPDGTYGGTSCGGFIVDVPSPMAHVGEKIFVTPPGGVNQGNCTTTYLTLKTYVNGGATPAQSFAGTAGTWNGSACMYGNGVNGVSMPFPGVQMSDLRIVAKVEAYASGGKGTSALTQYPVKVQISTTCENGVKDGDESGIDCGGSCYACPTPPPPPPPKCSQIICGSDANCNVEACGGSGSCIKTGIKPGRCVAN